MWSLDLRCELLFADLRFWIPISHISRSRLLFSLKPGSGVIDLHLPSDVNILGTMTQASHPRRQLDDRMSAKHVMIVVLEA